MAHPFADRAKTGQEMADSRYSDLKATSPTPNGILYDDAKVDHRGEIAEDSTIASPTRQVSQTGKVKK